MQRATIPHHFQPEWSAFAPSGGLRCGLALCVVLLVTACCESEPARRDGKNEGPPPLELPARPGTVQHFRAEIGGAPAGEADFPLALPPHPHARLIANAEQRGIGRMLVYAVADPPAAVSAFYRDAMRRAGWQLDFDGRVDSLPMLAFSRGRDRVRINIEPSGRGSQVAIAAADVP